MKSEAINTAAEEESATTISGSPKNASAKATAVPAAAVRILPVL